MIIKSFCFECLVIFICGPKQKPINNIGLAVSSGRLCFLIFHSMMECICCSSMVVVQLLQCNCCKARQGTFSGNSNFNVCLIVFLLFICVCLLHELCALLELPLLTYLLSPLQCVGHKGNEPEVKLAQKPKAKSWPRTFSLQNKFSRPLPKGGKTFC